MIKAFILKKSEKNCSIIQLYYQNESEENYDGIVIRATNQAVVFACAKDFEFDGYQVLLRNRIQGYRNSNFEKCYTQILLHNKQFDKIRPPKWVYSIDDVHSAIKGIKRYGIWPAIETIYNSESTFYVGPITSISEDKFTLHCYDAAGKWEKEYKLAFDEVIRIEWASKYCTHFNHYMKAHNPSLHPEPRQGRCSR